MSRIVHAWQVLGLDRQYFSLPTVKKGAVPKPAGSRGGRKYLSPEERLCLMRLLSFTSQDGREVFTGTRRAMAQTLRVPISLVSKLLNFLLKKAWIVSCEESRYEFTEKFYAAMATVSYPLSVGNMHRINKLIRTACCDWRLENQVSKRYQTVLSSEFFQVLLLFLSDSRGVIKGMGLKQLADVSGVSTDTVRRYVGLLMKENWVRYATMGCFSRHPLRAQPCYLILNLQSPTLQEHQVPVRRLILNPVSVGDIPRFWAMDRVLQEVQDGSSRTISDESNEPGAASEENEQAAVDNDIVMLIDHLKALTSSALVKRNYQAYIAEVIAWLIDNHKTSLKGLHGLPLVVDIVERQSDWIRVGYPESIESYEIHKVVYEKLKAELFVEGAEGNLASPSVGTDVTTPQLPPTDQESSCNLARYLAFWIVFMAREYFGQICCMSGDDLSRSQCLILPRRHSRPGDLQIVEFYSRSSTPTPGKASQLVCVNGSWQGVKN